MKFSRKRILTNLNSENKYTGKITNIEHIELEKRNYYNITIELDEGLTSIWVNDNVTPDHPLFEIFDNMIEDEADAEDFDEKEIIGVDIQFTVKKISTKGNKEHIFFDKVTPLWEEEEYEDEE